MIWTRRHLSVRMDLGMVVAIGSLGNRMKDLTEEVVGGIVRVRRRGWTSTSGTRST